MRVEKSQALYRDAKRYTAVGPASPTGAFDQVGRDPRFMVGGSARIYSTPTATST